jgi:mycothiol synthase
VPSPSLRTPPRPDAKEIEAIRALVVDVARKDGRDPLSDQALTRLGDPEVEHVLAYEDDRLVGYAQLAARSLEIAAVPQAIGTILDAFAGRDVLVWSHGEHSRLTSFLDDHGFVRQRELFQLRRAMTDTIDAPPMPDGVELRPFVVGRDEDAWLAVNSAAFAHHPEQGSWTAVDLQAREREPWFDADGFLLAWRGDDLLGYHWTKVHPNGDGEVYVIGIAPAAQGMGLGKILLMHGLDWLRRRGCSEVLLYVDGDNTTAVRLYERTGFVRHDLDVQWGSPADQSSETGTVSNT